MPFVTGRVFERDDLRGGSSRMGAISVAADLRDARRHMKAKCAACGGEMCFACGECENRDDCDRCGCIAWTCDECGKTLLGKKYRIRRYESDGPVGGILLDQCVSCCRGTP